ncbi:CD82 antigen-like [Sinocyclocheilus anshuiensis]|uniref:CD82 antigen-like n=1 Tax=Sinocyclocheilus anshuiensis TaxID=1608454 RepID=UPI0007B80A5E|nr:PREDICTED: CD82 antigen-like [Sinocyclocheilus anshuiensis]
MGKGCIAATKYFLFMFNLLFFIFGAVILGFGLWVMLDNQKFITVLHESTTLKVGTYILIGIGSLSMLMGFLGCIGAIYEVRCLLGLYFTCLLLILIAQVTAAVLIYFQRDLVGDHTSESVQQAYSNGGPRDIMFFLSQTSEQAWDYLQRTMKCCGWTGPSNWTENVVINSQKNNSQILYPCSCRNESISGTDIKETGLCEALSPEWPVFTTGCISSVEDWLLRNCGVILGVCVGIAVIELLGMILSMCLCKSIQQEDYTKVPKY